MELELRSEPERIMKEMLSESGKNIVGLLSEKYEFDREEALKYLDLGGKKVKMKTEKVEKNSKNSKIPLPFCGEISESNCCGIRLNHGLYTQCTNDYSIEHNENGNIVNVCKTCYKQIEKNSDNKPTYGYIMDRVKLGDKFRDPKGKSPVKYGNIMEKLNITREQAEKEAEKYGLTIPEEEFEIKKVQRGRPKKDTVAVDTSGSEDEPIKKSRGRPKKEKKVVSTNVGEDLIKDLVSKSNEKPEKIENLEPAKIEKEIPSSSSSSSSDDSINDSSDDEEELAVTEFTINGKKYLKAADNTIYDRNTHEEIGRWNPKTKVIEEDYESD